MPKNNSLLLRLRKALEFRQLANDEKLFRGLSEQLAGTYQKRFGKQFAEFVIDPDGWPPVNIVAFQGCGRTQAEQQVLLTSGMSYRPQPNVELNHPKPQQVRRIELAIWCHQDSPFSFEQALEILGKEARYPWRFLTWFGHGHTCQIQVTEVVDSNQAKTNSNNELTFRFLLLDDRSVGDGFDRGDDPRLRFRDDPIKLLWLVPVGADELSMISNNLDGFIDQLRTQSRLLNAT